MTILDPRPRPGHGGRDAAKPDPRASTLTLPSRPGTIPLPPRPGTMITIPPRPGTVTATRQGHAGAQRRRAGHYQIAQGQTAHHLAHPIARPHNHRPDLGQVPAQSANGDLRSRCRQYRARAAGRLITGDVIAEAGLSAHPKAAKPAPRSEALEINHGSAAKCVEEP